MGKYFFSRVLRPYYSFFTLFGDISFCPFERTYFDSDRVVFFVEENLINGSTEDCL